MSQKLDKNILKKIKNTRDDLTPEKGQRKRAIAVKYDVDKDRAPKILAIGQGRIADMILEIAEEHKVPFYEDNSMAALLSKLEISREIPPELYKMVAEVLAFVYQLGKLRDQRKKLKKKQQK